MDLVLIFYGCGGFDVLYYRIDEFEGTNGLYWISPFSNTWLMT